MSAPIPQENPAFPPFEITQSDHLLSDFSSMDKARQTLANYLVRLTRSPVQKDYALQVVDLMTKLESRSLKWSSIKFQLLTLPDTADVHEFISLQTQVSIIPEFRQAFSSNCNNRGRGNSIRGRGRGGTCGDFDQFQQQPQNNFQPRSQFKNWLWKSKSFSSKSFERLSSKCGDRTGSGGLLLRFENCYDGWLWS